MTRKHRTALNRLSSSVIEQWAELGESFEAAAMSGQEGRWDTGRLNEDWSEVYRADREYVVYTVLSYATPIAWKLADGRWVVPDQKFSVSTGRHQRIVRQLRPQREYVAQES